MDTDNTNYLYKDLTSEILNCAFEVRNDLGCGFLEKVYEKALVYELKLRGLKVKGYNSKINKNKIQGSRCRHLFS